MSALVRYGSSDEDEENVGSGESQIKASIESRTVDESSQEQTAISNGHTEPDLNAPIVGPARDNGYVIGPQVVPNRLELERDIKSTPQSPYSVNRALIADLTLPPMPNLDIPESPPGSPPLGMDQKFGHFLDLKKQGIHFNEKLARSSALKNPSLLSKLMDFAGVEEQEQYATTLTRDVWDPAAFPSWAYKVELAKSQQEISKKREEDLAKAQRENIAFVSASVSGPFSGTATPASGINSKGLRGSAAERIMAGLDRERSGSPQTLDVASRSINNRKAGRNDTDSRLQARSRSPGRRKRSRSR